MTITLTGVAIAVAIFLLFRGSCGRIGMVLLLMAGSVLTFAATLASIAWRTGSTLSQVLTSFGGAVG